MGALGGFNSIWCVTCFSLYYFTLCIYIIWTCRKKLHTCEEGGEQLRISFWHLSIGELEKQLFTKICWSGPIKNVRILIFPMLYFLKKIKKNISFYNCVPKILIIWSDLQFLRYLAWQTEIGKFGSLFALLML